MRRIAAGAEDSESAIDQFIAALPPGQRQIATALRRLLREIRPPLEERVRWGYPSYASGGDICSIIPVSDRINLAFFLGAGLADPEGLLEGDGKSMRHVKITSAEEIPASAITELVRRSVRIRQARRRSLGQ